MALRHSVIPGKTSTTKVISIAPNSPHYDVIVVGGGGSGLAAALSAAEAGGRVLLLESQPHLGGTTGIAIGSFTAAGTSLQRKKQIDDAWTDHSEDVAKFAPPEIEARNHEALRRFFLSEAAATFEWLLEMGLTFVGPHPEPPNRHPRMHNVVPGAKAYIAELQLALQRFPVEIVCEATAKLLLQQEGRIIGVRALVSGAIREYLAGSVVLAGGDYANNPDLIAEFKGEGFRDIEGINPYATGEGHCLAREVGAKLLNMDVTYGPELRFVPARRRPFQQLLPASGRSARWLGGIAKRLPDWLLRKYVKRLLVTWQHPEDALLEDGAILVNQQGTRFVNELASPDREQAVARQPGRHAYLLLDQRLMERYGKWPHFISTAPDIAYAYVDDYLRLRPDVAVKGNDFSDVARKRGLPGHPLEQTVDALNRTIRAGKPDRLGRPRFGPPLENGPCLLLGPVKAYFTTTEGGVAINQSLQVLDGNDNVIPGLYAAGQNGLGGMILWGHGLHIAWALTSGRLVGKLALEHARIQQTQATE
jgi:succinate dehydrogenase/fumarate reductase flavoprotein subunit